MKNIITKLFIVINDSQYLMKNQLDSSLIQDIEEDSNLPMSSAQHVFDSLKLFKLSSYEFRNDWKSYPTDLDRIVLSEKLVSYYQRLN